MAIAEAEALARPTPPRRASARLALARRVLADSRVRTAAFAYLFAAVCYATVAGYKSAYPTLADRLALAHAFGDNVAARLFYGKPYDLLTPGGFAAWRAAGVLSIFAALAGSLAAVRALRAEEEAGRTELLLANPISRAEVFGATSGAAAATAAVLWLAAFAGLILGGLPAGGSAYLALATVTATPVFVGVGALASQLAPTRRGALLISGGALAGALLIRVLADTVSGLDWLRWATPLGWAEELRPFTGARPAVLALPVLSTVALTLAARAIVLRRDIGTGLLPSRDTQPPRLYLLSSPTALALRELRGTLLAWAVGSCVFGVIIGTVSTSIASAGLSSGLRRQLHKLGSISITSPAGYIALTFLFFALAFSLFAVSHVAAARREESEQRLETLLAMPVSRRRWLAGRLLLAGATAATLAVVAGAATWVGAAFEHAHISFARLLEAGGNTLPAALLFLGLGALAFALAPRASSGIAYGLVGLAFVWELFGALIGMPKWLLGVSPFHQLALVPAQSFRTVPAVVMCALAVVASLAAVELFARRDLRGD